MRLTKKLLLTPVISALMFLAVMTVWAKASLAQCWISYPYSSTRLQVGNSLTAATARSRTDVASVTYNVTGGISITSANPVTSSPYSVSIRGNSPGAASICSIVTWQDNTTCNNCNSPVSFTVVAAPTTCQFGGYFFNSRCWYLGGTGQSCAETCSSTSAGLICDPATSWNDTTNCDIGRHFATSCIACYNGDNSDAPPYIWSTGGFTSCTTRGAGYPASCTSGHSNVNRICPCIAATPTPTPTPALNSCNTYGGWVTAVPPTQNIGRTLASVCADRPGWFCVDSGCPIGQNQCSAGQITSAAGTASVQSCTNIINTGNPTQFPVTGASVCCASQAAPTPTATPTPTPLFYCNSSNCSGCCSLTAGGYSCLGGTSDSACGTGGNECVNCTYLSQECSASGQCVSTPEPPPPPGGGGSYCQVELDAGGPRIGNPIIAVLNGASGLSFFGCILPNLIAFGLIIAALVFVFMLIIAGISWITSGGDKAAIEAAKNRIVHALIGFTVVLSIFAIAKLIELFFGVNILILDVSSLRISASGAGCNPSAGGGTPDTRVVNPLLGDLKLATGLGFFQCFVPNLVGLGFLAGVIIFMFIMLLGGIGWITSGGDKAAIEASKQKIINALTGLIILFSVFAIISLIQTFLGISIITLSLGGLVIQ